MLCTYNDAPPSNIPKQEFPRDQRGMVKTITLLYLDRILRSLEILNRKPVSSASLRVVAFRVCFVPSFCLFPQSGSFGLFGRMLERHPFDWGWRHGTDSGSGAGYQLDQSHETDRGLSGINTQHFRFRV